MFSKKKKDAILIQIGQGTVNVVGVCKECIEIQLKGIGCICDNKHSPQLLNGYNDYNNDIKTDATHVDKEEYISCGSCLTQQNGLIKIVNNIIFQIYNNYTKYRIKINGMTNVALSCIATIDYGQVRYVATYIKFNWNKAKW